MPPRVHRYRNCDNCGKHGRIDAHGWCHACYQRWRNGGRPESGPPPAAESNLTAAHNATRDMWRENLAVWRKLRAEGKTQRAIATEMGVSMRTVQRYHAADEQIETVVDAVMARLRESGLWEKAA